MKIKIKTKRTVLKGIKEGKYNPLNGYMLKNHCGRICEVVGESIECYKVIFGCGEDDIVWIWPKWACKVIKEDEE